MSVNSDLLQSYESLPEAKRIEVNALLDADWVARPWRPIVDVNDIDRLTPQQGAHDSIADFLFYGGAAGGGKTDLLIGLALTKHQRSIIFRREAKQLRAITDRVRQILGSKDGFNSQQNRWQLPNGRLLDLGGVKDSGDEQAYQGQPHDFIAFDELPQFLESQFRFLVGWNRTTDPNQRCRVVGAGNPPTSAEGEWVIRFWGPWLDEQYANPALPGELRWFATVDGEDVERETPEPFEHDGETIQPKSRTFVPSSVEDNPYLTATGYKAMLQALPEPLRSQMLRGDFTAGRDDDPWQVIPTEWVKLAQERWEAKKPGGPMHAMGVDVARGGADNTVLTARYGDWFAPQIVEPGKATPNGQTAAALTVAYLRDDATAYVDVIGVGASAYDHLDGLRVNVRASHASQKSFGRDRSGKLGFVNKRAEWWWKMREALDPQYGDNLAIPPDRELLVDLCTPRWKVTTRGIQVELKEEIIKRIGRSPDKGDSAVLALQPKRTRMEEAEEGTGLAWGRS